MTAACNFVDLYCCTVKLRAAFERSIYPGTGCDDARQRNKSCRQLPIALPVYFQFHLCFPTLGVYCYAISFYNWISFSNRFSYIEKTLKPNLLGGSRDIYLLFAGDINVTRVFGFEGKISNLRFQ